MSKAGNGTGRPSRRLGPLARLRAMRAAQAAVQATQKRQAAKDYTPLHAAELRATADALRLYATGFDEFAEQLAAAEAEGQDAHGWLIRLGIRGFCPSLIALFETLALRCTPVATGEGSSDVR